ncbi:MAG TPA: pirin-like C-terminal cupin domain-containing protein, partial [Sphingomicrobium sp.]|nr:pirin-like C-terminal cupin domain-containing protein [Sphingomicrobium sp.]
IQTWLAMPRDKEELPAAFEHVGATDLPAIDADGVEVRLIMGDAYGSRSPVTCHSPTLYAALEMTPGSSIEVDNEADERAVYLLDGDAEIDGIALQPTHLVLLRPGHRPLLRSQRGARLMICGGAPMDGERHVWWNFVSSRRDRINEAKRAWKAGEFALPPDDDGEFIPLPEMPLTVSYP